MSNRDTPEPPDNTNPPEELIAQLERDAGMGVENVESPGSEEHDRPWLLDQTIGHTALEKLCIAIIRAHPIQDRNSTTTDRQRLNQALRALTGTGPKEKNNALDDRNLLLSMADEFLRSPDLLAGRRTAAELAADAVNCGALAASALERFGLGNHSSPRRRLADKFRAEWQSLVGSVQNASYVAHSIEAKELAKVAESLRQMGVGVNIPDEAGAFWTLASEK